jgi:hypothetical protein
MFKVRVAALPAVAAIASMVILDLAAPLAMAQGVDVGASTPKQVQKSQRKAARKAARGKNNAELKTLEQNGYQPGMDQAKYPENVQDAERKAAATKGASGQ